MGSINSVTIGDNFGDGTTDCYMATDGGSIGSVTVKGNMEDADIRTYDSGKIGTVWVLGNLENDSEILIAGAGNITDVQIGESMLGSIIETQDGSIGNVLIGGDLDDYTTGAATGATTQTSTIEAQQGNIGTIRIGVNMADGSQILNSGGTTGIGSVSIGGNLTNSTYTNGTGGGSTTTTISSTGIGGVGAVTVGGSLYGTAGADTNVLIDGDGGVQSVSVGGTEGADYLDITAGTATGRLIGSVSVVGSLANSMINDISGGTISSVNCGELEDSTIATGATTSAMATPTGTRADFTTQNSDLGSLTVAGILVSGPVTVSPRIYWIDSDVFAWNIGSATFTGLTATTTGTGIVQYHSIGRNHWPSGVTVNQIV